MIDFEGRQEVIKVIVGSHNYNLNTETSDKDYKFFVAPTFNDLYYSKMFSSGEQSDEFDYTVHDIRQLGNLLWKSNINFIEVLFSISAIHDVGLSALFNENEKWASMNLPAFYSATRGMSFQKMEELKKGTAKTDALIEKFGYDTKQACHALRCLYVLEQYAETRKMAEALRFYGAKRQILLDVKNGEYTEDAFVSIVQEWHVTMDGEMKAFYSEFQPMENWRVELENMMFDFVKAKMIR
jgi:predicted nucleotidyltransferase